MNNKNISSDSSAQIIETHLLMALEAADKARLSIVAIRISEALDCLKLNPPPDGADVDQTYS